MRSPSASGSGYRAETGLTASVGAASTKFLAKLCSDLAKPDGLLAIEPGTEAAFLAPLPLSRLWGVGPATRKKLERMGLRTIGDVGALDETVLVRALGQSLGAHLYALAHNDDDRAVVAERETKSVGAEETFAADLRTGPACDRELVRLADKVGARLRQAELAARTITLKVRFTDFETRTRARTLPNATDISAVVLETARELLAEFDLARGIRLLGISCSQFGDPTPHCSPTLFNDEPTVDVARTERRAAVERAMDGVRDRFGATAVRPATLVEPATTERGDLAERKGSEKP